MAPLLGAPGRSLLLLTFVGLERVSKNAWSLY